MRGMIQSSAWIAVAAVGLGGCATLRDWFERAPKPQLRLDAVRFEGLDLSGVDLKFDVSIENPYSVPLPIARIDAALSHDGAPFVQTGVDESTSVPAQGSEQLTFPVTLRFAETLKVLGSLRPGSSFPYAADLKFGLDAPTGPIEVPVHHEGELWIPAPPKVSVPRIRVLQANLQGVRLEARLGIESENQVPLTLEGMSAAVRLAGVPVAQAQAPERMSIPPEGRTEWVVPMELSVAQVGLSLVKALGGGALEYGIEGDLTLDTPLGSLSQHFDEGGRAPLVN